MTKRTAIGLIYTIFSAIVIISGTIMAIRWANGDFRRDLQSGLLVSESGLLSATSTPVGAQVFIDGRLASVTDNVFYLEPGTYEITIQQDGFSTWRQTMQIERGLVTTTNARLFPSSPSLFSLTFTGAENLSVSPDGQKLIFFTASASAQARNGFYFLDLGTSGNQAPRAARQLTDNEAQDLANAEIIWSSDSSEILIKTNYRTFLVPIGPMTSLATAPDVTWRVRTLLSTWEEDMYLREREYLARFPAEIIEIATQSAINVYFSPDKRKIVYTATEYIAIPSNIIPAIPAASTQQEDRNLVPGGIYVFDLLEDRNFRIGTASLEDESLNKNFLLANDALSRTPLSLAASPSAFTRLQASPSAEITTAQLFKAYHSPLHTGGWQWLSDSRHLVGVINNQIVITSYDGTNTTTVYSGPFLNNFVYPWADGSRLLILTTFSPEAPANIYSIELVR
ncbi:MAG: PEGA domain-containing protein [Pseudomonadales bacterium]|nr:PEGA domain-containing protein [Pseudomonadales bacterium]